MKKTVYVGLDRFFTELQYLLLKVYLGMNSTEKHLPTISSSDRL